MHMNSQKFTLNLFDTTRTGLLTTLLLLGSFALLGLSIWALMQAGAMVGGLLALAIVGGGGYAGWRAYQRAAVVPLQLTITPTELHLEDLRPVPRWSQTVRLGDITTYRYYNVNNTEELRLNRAGMSPLKLRSAGILADGSNLAALVAAFEQAIEAVPQPAGLGVRRERTFFEKPISTYLLGLFTLLFAALAWEIVSGALPVRGSLFTALGSYVTYVAAWRLAAARRNAPR